MGMPPVYKNEVNDQRPHQPPAFQKDQSCQEIDGAINIPSSPNYTNY